MNTKGLKTIVSVIIIIMLVLLIIIGVLLYIIYGGKDYTKRYEERFSSGELVNPVKDLSLEEAVEKFDAEFVLYILYSIKAYNLHSSPLSSDKPKLEFKIDELVYNAYVEKGEIIVSEGEISDEDIIIFTTKEEGVKMLQDRNYIEESFSSGASSVESIAGEVELASKGYFGLYTDLTGKSISGMIIYGF